MKASGGGREGGRKEEGGWRKEEGEEGGGRRFGKVITFMLVSFSDIFWPTLEVMSLGRGINRY